LNIYSKDGVPIWVSPESQLEKTFIESMGKIFKDEILEMLKGAMTAEEVIKLQANIKSCILVCDKCGAIAYTESETMDGCREEAKKLGWTVDVPKEGFPIGADFCPDCKEEE
jgi:hypothetical protein